MRTAASGSQGSLQLEEKALKYLTRRDRSEAEMRAFLGRRGAAPGAIRALMRRLSEWGYLDDAAVAARWARTRIARQPMGRLRLEAELLSKGIDREITQRVVGEILGQRSERELAERVLARRSAGRRLHNAAQAAALLMRYGFEDDVITSVVGSFCAGRGEA